MTILGIETSCDETAAAVAQGENGRVEILSNVVASQIDIHQKYGGVVPEVAAREHVLNILPVINETLKKTGISRPSVKNIRRKVKNSKFEIRNSKLSVDALAVTIGPGLITSLQVGIETAKTLAYVWKLPLVAVNHIEAHIYANFINTQHETRNMKQIINFPAVILTVSGGHTMLVLMKRHGKFETIGETRDDAAGEAFDKAASMLGLGYPGGPAIAKSAEQFTKTPSEISNSEFRISNRFLISNNLKLNNSKLIQDSKFKIQNSISLPRPMIKDKSFDFSFSGLKTALRYELEKDKNWQKRIPEYATEFQEAVTDVLVYKTIKAAKKYGVKNVMLAGGVSANHRLREKMAEAVKQELPGVQLNIPDLKYTTDNAAMVAAAGYFKALRKNYTPWQKLRVDCNAKL